MKQFWAGLQPRERHILIAGAVVLTLLALYALAWEPYQGRIERLEQQVAAARADLAWMRGAAAEVRALARRAPEAATDGRSLLATADSTARAHGLSQALKRVQPDGQRSVQVWLEAAAFDDVVRWLDTLVERHGISVSSLVVDRGAGAGQVNARVVLEGAGG